MYDSFLGRIIPRVFPSISFIAALHSHLHVQPVVSSLHLFSFPALAACDSPLVDAGNVSDISVTEDQTTVDF